MLFKQPPIHEVCPNHEVTKPWKGTSPDLGYVAYCYVYTLFPSLSYLFASQCPPEEETHSCPSSHAIAGRPFCPFTGSSAHPGVPFLRTRILKIHRLPCHFLYKVLRSPEIIPSPSVFSITQSSLAPLCRNLFPPTPNITTTSVFLLPRPSHHQKFFYIGPCLHQGSQRFPPSVLLHMLFTQLVYWPQLHPLFYRGLLTIDILPQSLRLYFPENN